MGSVLKGVLMVEDPVTLAITRVPKSGREREWEEVVAEIQRTAYGFPGNLGATVLKPVSRGTRAYQIIVRFDSMANFRCWESSHERQQLLKRLRSLESEPVKIAQATGMETWFELPGESPVNPPPRYKMMIASGIGVYLTITPLLYILRSFLDGLPVYAVTLVVVPVTVVLLTYVTMPLIIRGIIRSWLCGNPHSTPRTEET